MNLYDWLKEKDNDYDTYDTVYDICVTVCVPYEGLFPEWYDKFCNFILKHVDVIEETSDYECIADWNKFIEDNAETFKKITEESWSYMPDDEDFNYEWINEIDKLLTGYGSEKTYHYLMDMFTKNNIAYRTERNAYKNVLNNKVRYANSQNVNDIIVKLDSIINSISDVKIQNELRDVQNQIRELVK